MSSSGSRQRIVRLIESSKAEQYKKFLNPWKNVIVESNLCFEQIENKSNVDIFSVIQKVSDTLENYN